MRRRFRSFGAQGLAVMGGAGATQAYWEKILPYFDIGLWRLNETSGTTADNAEGTAARDATYVGVTLDNSTGPDGSPAGFWDGLTDYVHWTGAQLTALASAINKNTGTALIWIDVDAAFWTDGLFHQIFRLTFAGATDKIEIVKNANNTVDFRYHNGATNKAVNITPTDTDWTPFGITWDTVADELKAYKLGSQVGTTQTGLLVPDGALSIATLGASNATPANPFVGALHSFGLASRALTPAEMAIVSTL